MGNGSSKQKQKKKKGKQVDNSKRVDGEETRVNAGKTQVNGGEAGVQTKDIHFKDKSPRKQPVEQQPVEQQPAQPQPDNSTAPTMTHNLPKVAAVRESSMEPKDIMISYSHQDKDFMRQMKGALEKAGVTVWVDEINLSAGSEFLSKIGQAIIDCKLFLTILSPNSVISRYCKDELALAYVSSKPIFPCALVPFDECLKQMDFGTRLQLAPVQWTMFTKDRSFDDAFHELLSSMQYKLQHLQGEEVPALERTKTKRTRINKYHRTESVDEEENEDFWEVNFGTQGEVPWDKFRDTFKTFVKTEFKELDLPSEWLMSLLAQEVDEDGDQVVDRKAYEDFIHIDGERIDFLTRVKEQALETYTMHQVFNMESTVRLDAIHNLSKFRSDSVVEALLDLCVDSDANVRAVAAISLARSTDNTNPRVVKKLISLLKDRDRLVRESGCLALGHIKAKEAVGKLVNIWRNDFISTVREAAQIALENIGGEEAAKAMHITKVLGEEIKALGKES